MSIVITRHLNVLKRPYNHHFIYEQQVLHKFLSLVGHVEV